MRNKLFTSTIDKLLFNQYKFGSNLSKQKVVAKIFNPYGEGRWYLLNSDPDDPDYLWAIVSMHGNVEIGSVSRNELMNLRLTKYGLPLERDLYFSPKNAQEVYQGLLEGKHYAKGGGVGKKLPPIILKKLQEKLTISKKAINKYGGEYYNKFPQLIKDQIDGKTPFTYENHLMVQGDEKKDHYDIFIENNAIELAKKIKKIVDKYKNKEVSNTSIQSAPNSSSFMASISGKIELVVNFIHYGGYYSGNNNLLIGVKIGNGIDSVTQKKIKQDIYEVMFPYDQYNASDGGVMWFNTSGTNYDTIGLRCNTLQFNDSLAEKIENIFNSNAYAKGGIVGLSVSGYTIKGRKGNYYIQDVQGRLVEKTYETLDEVKKAFDRLVVMRAHQKHESKSMSETLADVDRFYDKGGKLQKLNKTQKEFYERVANTINNNTYSKSITTYNLPKDTRQMLEELYYMGYLNRYYFKGTQEAEYTLKFAKGGEVNKRVILSFSFNSDNISLDDVTEIVENYTKDWRTGGDIFEPNFYVNLRESEANELKDELESYGYFNDIEIEDSRYQYADGGELDLKKKVRFDEGGETSDQHYEPTYLMTLDEYINLGIPTTIKNYEKFIKKNGKYLARAGYSGLDYWTLEDALESSKNPFEEYSSYDWIPNIEELGGTTRIDYARAKDFDDWSDTKYTQDPTPIDIRVENQVFREKLSKYFPHRTHKYKEKTWTTSGMQRIENEFKKTNKVAIRNAMQDGVYKKLLNTGKISIDRLKEITDSVGVRITKDTLSGDKKVEFMEGLKKTLSGLPQKSFDKVKEFAEDFHKELKEISDIVYEREYKRLSDVILSFVGKRVEMSRVSMAIPISLFSIYDYTSEEIEGKTKYYYDRITMVDIKALQPNWEKYLKDYVKYYVESLKWNIVSVMADVFRKVTIPIKSYQKISLDRGVNGFEGSYKFNFEDGSSFVVNTQGVGAGGYNIQVFHYRYLTNITNATLPSGEVTKDLSHWEKRYAKGGLMGYERLVKKVAKNYEGKSVPKKYQSEYGKTYDKGEAKEVGYKVATKVYGMPLAKMKK
jgi:hypothetical protein